jgi:hypothetical protein
MNSAQENDLQLNEWMQEEQHQEGVEILKESAVIPFATALWA